MHCKTGLAESNYLGMFHRVTVGRTEICLYDRICSLQAISDHRGTWDAGRIRFQTYFYGLRFHWV
jgi:hypothetical protein